MESREVINSQETVAAPEGASNSPVAPTTETSTALVDPSRAASAGSAGTSGKKKRGRPRKYRPDGIISSPLPLVPVSASAPSVTGINLADRASGGLPSASKKKHKARAENSGKHVPTPIMPHVIVVNAGEDVSMKIISFCQQGPQSVCVMSGNGLVSNATIRRPDPSGGATLTFEGLFEILSLSGSFTAKDLGEGRVSRAGGLSIIMSSADGRIVGGALAGLLIAASPVQVIVGSFLEDFKEPKPNKQKHDQEDSKVAATVDHTTYHAEH